MKEPQTPAERKRAAELAKKRNPTHASGNEGRTHPGLVEDGHGGVRPRRAGEGR